MPKERALVAIPCKLSPGAFSGERVFALTLANGEGYTSLAPRQFCWNESGKLVGDHEPTAQSDGLVAARVVESLDDGQVQVEVPDGEVIAVDEKLVRPRPTAITPPTSSLQTAG